MESNRLGDAPVGGSRTRGRGGKENVALANDASLKTVTLGLDAGEIK